MFRQYLSIATTMAVALTGCASTRLINPEKPSDLAMMSFKQDQKVRVTTSDGQWFLVSNLQVKPDSTRWFDGRQFVSVATSDINEVTRIRRGKGALQGLGLGLLSGAAVGGFIGIASYEPCDNCLIDFGPGFSLMAGSALGVVAGAPFGILVGASVGSKSKYQFQEPQIPEKP
jgi:hypothetical protein